MADASTGAAPADVESLQAELTRLRGENTNMRNDLDASNKELRAANAEARDRRHEVRELTERLNTTTTERDGARASAATAPNEWKAKYEETLGKVRGLTHGAAFDKLARELGVTDPNRLDALRTLSGFQPADADDPDEPAIKTTINSTLGRFDWLKDPAPASGEAAGTAGRAGRAGTNAAGAATQGPGAQHGASTGQAGPAPGSDRGHSPTSGQTTGSNRIPGRI